MKAEFSVCHPPSSCRTSARQGAPPRTKEIPPGTPLGYGGVVEGWSTLPLSSIPIVL